jgi:hypothetical protein
MNDAIKIRVSEEIAQLVASGASASFYEGPPAVVIYRNLFTPLGVVDRTDVLVPVPDGYPGVMIDHAFLPDDSALLPILKGQMEETFIVAGDRRWKRKSYHPHKGGGAPEWDPIRHGFHTYVDEILSWLAVRN